MVEWSRAFGDVPVYLHSADRRWVMRPDSALRFWDGEALPLHDGLTLIRCGGHFDGGTVLHWPSGADGRGALLTGDILQVCMDRRHVGFSYSYPNYIPLPAPAVLRAASAVAPYAFDRIYGFLFDLVIPSDAQAAVASARGTSAGGPRSARGRWSCSASGSPSAAVGSPGSAGKSSRWVGRVRFQAMSQAEFVSVSRSRKPGKSQVFSG
jgi:hypothetical protein